MTRQWKPLYDPTIKIPLLITAVVIGLASVTAKLASQTITIKNNLATSQYCATGNTLTVFAGSNQHNIASGGHASFSGDFTVMPGLGIQVNNWYWVVAKAPVAGAGADQNPDNSGAQFAITSDCIISQKSAPWYGKGVETYEIVDVTAAKDSNGQCVVTVGAIDYTEAVTPGCCSPPDIGSNNCTSDQWGQTANGLAWPPPQN